MEHTRVAVLETGLNPTTVNMCGREKWNQLFTILTDMILWEEREGQRGRKGERKGEGET